MNVQEAPLILVVDDDDWILSGVTVALAESGFDVCSASDGKEALAIALRRRPDVIVTDVVMPEMDGWTFVRRLRSDSRFALVPVLFLTCQGSAQDRINGFQLGADDYIGKPVNLSDLPRRIKRALAHRRQLEVELGLNPPLAATGGKGLRGTLDQVGMATLLSVIASGSRSGILRLTRGLRSSEILIYLVRGRIYRVEVEDRGRLTGTEALRELFHWLEGDFEFTPMTLRLADELNVSINTLLLQGACQGASAATPT